MVFTSHSTGRTWSLICMQDRLVDGLYFSFDVRVSKKLCRQDCLLKDVTSGAHFAQKCKKK